MQKQIYVLPRLRITTTQHGNSPLVISKATFYPDLPEVWQEELKLPRPEWLDIFREFHVLDHELEPKPARGTLIVSDDDDWLREHISRLIGVIYVIGEECRRWKTPSDAFNYRGFFASNEKKQMVNFRLKTSSKTDDLRSLQLTPGLGLRGVDPCFRVDMTVAENQKLVELFDANPYDRLAVASYHLFRTQFEDPVVAPSEQDFAGYCSCLEAAFNIHRRDCLKQLSDQLVQLYGEPIGFRRWISGLYSQRSIFNHGSDVNASTSDPDDEVRRLAEFRNRRLSWDLLRKICLDVILDQLTRRTDNGLNSISRLWNSTQEMLDSVFCSEGIWAKIAAVFTQCQSVKKINSLEGEEKIAFANLCQDFVSIHNWQAVQKVNKHKLFAALKAMAAIIGEAALVAENTEDVQIARELYGAADDEDEDAVDNWGRAHAGLGGGISNDDVATISKSVASHAAKYFCAH